MRPEEVQERSWGTAKGGTLTVLQHAQGEHGLGMAARVVGQPVLNHQIQRGAAHRRLHRGLGQPRQADEERLPC